MRKFLPLLTGSLNEVSRGDAIADDELQECPNYEETGEGILEKRKKIETYETKLNTLLATYDEVITISEPFYPKKKLSDQYSSFLLFAFIISGTNYKLYYIYKDGADSWTSTQVSISEVSYTNESNMKITIGEDKVIFTDGINIAHYFKIDEDGTAISGIMGIPAPLNKPHIQEMTDWSDQDWETNENNQRLSEPGLFQCLYTVVTEEGEESNPSPLSDTKDMQWFKLTSGEDTRWIDKITISDLSIPSVPADIKNKLKYFKVYIRTIRYSEGEAPQQLQFSQQFEITDKEKISGTPTGNSYTITVEYSPGEYPSYENDVAPVASLSSELAGVTVLSNCKTKIKFPFDFKYYCKINLNNINSVNVIDAVIKIRLWDKDSGESDAIDNLSWADFDTNNDDEIQASLINKIRIYDKDLTTPLNVDYIMDTSAYWCDIYVKIPQLERGNNHIIYLCFGSTSDGVDDANLQTFAYGKWFSLDNDTWSYQEVFQSEKVKTDRSLLCAPMNLEVKSDECYNKSDTTFDGSFTNVSWAVVPIAKIPQINQLIGDKSLKITAAAAAHIDFDTLGLSESPSKGTIYGRINYNGTFVVGDHNIFYLKQNKDCRLQIHLPIGVFYWDFYIGLVHYDFEKISSPGNAVGTNYNYFILFSWDEAGFSLFVLNMTNGTIETELKTPGPFDLTVFANLYIGGTGNVIDNAYYDQWQFIKNIYFNAENIDDINTVMNIANFMPAFESLLGLKYFHTDVIVNGVFAADTDWTKGTGWTIAAGKASCDASQVADTDLTQTVAPLTSGLIYLVKFTVSNYVAGNICAVVGTQEGTDRFANGTYIESILSGSASFKMRGDVNFDGDIDNVFCYELELNNNITFDPTEEIEFKQNKNLVKWTDIYHQNFPDLYYKKTREPVLASIPSPSFLKLEYANSVIIWTRNFIERFVFKDSPDGWKAKADSLIEEYKQNGLLAPESLKRAGETLLWLSEAGLMMWNSLRMKNISKYRINIGAHEMAIGMFCPIRNQYLLYTAVKEPSVSLHYRFPDGYFGTNFGHQGVASDGTYVYITSNSDIRKYLISDGSLIAEKVNAKLEGTAMSQVNSIEIYGTNLYVGSNNYNGTPKRGYIKLFNRTTLAYVTEHQVNDNWNEGCSYHNGYFWAVYTDVQTISQYDTSWNKVKDHPTKLYMEPHVSMVGYQGSTWIGNFFLVNEHDAWYDDKLHVYYYNGCDFIPVCKIAWIHQQDGQGIYWDGEYLWWLERHYYGSGEGAIMKSTIDLIEIIMYEIEKDKFRKFSGMDIRKGIILSESNLAENLNLILNTANQVNKYPGDGYTSEAAYIKTKEFFINKGIFRRLKADFEGSGVNVITTVKNTKSDGSQQTKTDTKSSINANVWRGIANSVGRGRSADFKIENANIIKSLIFDADIIGK